MASTTRVDLRGSFTLPVPPSHAFPLFTARGETEWVDDWDPTYVHPTSGELEEDQVFVTGEGDEQTIWSVVHLDAPTYRVDYLRVTPGSRVARVMVSLSALPSGCRVDVCYRCTPLNEAGAREVATFARGFDAMLDDWRARTERLTEGP